MRDIGKRTTSFGTASPWPVRLERGRKAVSCLRWVISPHRIRTSLTAERRRGYDNEISVIFEIAAKAAYASKRAAYGGFWRARQDSNLRPQA